MRRPAVALLALLALSPAARAAPGLSLGAGAEPLRAADPYVSRAGVSVIERAGFGAVRVGATWAPGRTTPGPAALLGLSNAVTAAQRAGLRVFLSVQPEGAPATPLTVRARLEFAQFVAALVRSLPGVRDVIVGNEPNDGRSWRPQFRADGTSAAPAAYLALLTATYDALKALDPAVTVYGGALAAEGADRPGTGAGSLSPTRFIGELGEAYRASGRAEPVMDGFVLHPPLPGPGRPPDAPGRGTALGIADHARLLLLLGQAFEGTAQRGSDLPVLYDGLRVESAIPPGKLSAYAGSEPPDSRPVDERTQAAYYERALQLAFCQPHVVGLILPYPRDDVGRAGSQAGLFYADGTAKSSAVPVTDALARTRGGSIARCPELELTPRLLGVRIAASGARGSPPVVRLRCDLDCVYELRIEGAGGSPARARGFARAGVVIEAPLPGRRLAAGRYRLSLTLRHPLNPGAPTVVARELRIT
jgi:hypothetical protein